MDQFHDIPLPSLDHGAGNTSIIHEVKNSSDDNNFGPLQSAYREKIRSEIAEEDCTKSMNALLRIGDLKKKGAYKGLTRGMSFEEINACVNLELANLSQEFGAKQPDLSMSLDEMKQWLDKEFVAAKGDLKFKAKKKSKLNKIVNEANKIKQILNDKVQNAKQNSEQENVETTWLGTSVRNLEMNAKAYADQRSLFPLQKYVESPSKHASTPAKRHSSSQRVLVQCPQPSPEPRTLPPSTPNDKVSGGHTQRQGKDERTRKPHSPEAPSQALGKAASGTAGDDGGGGDCVHETPQRCCTEKHKRPEEALGPARVWLQKQRRAASHRRCEACVVKEFASDAAEDYPRTRSPRSGLDRDLFKNDAMPYELSADVTFLGPYYTRLLSKYMKVKEGRDPTWMNDTASQFSDARFDACSPTDLEGQRVKSYVYLSNKRLPLRRTTTTTTTSNQGVTVNERKTSNDFRNNNKIPRVYSAMSIRNSFRPNLPVGLHKGVPCNSRATSKTVMSTRNLLKPNLSASSNKKVPCNSRCTSKTTVPIPKRPQSALAALQTNQEPPRPVTQPPDTAANKEAATKAEGLSKEPEATSEPPRVSKTDSDVLMQSGLLSEASKPDPAAQAELDRPATQQTGGSCEEGVGGDAQPRSEGGGAGDDVTEQMSACELVRQWLTDSPQRPNEAYARKHAEKQQKDFAAFNKTQKTAELERIYGRFNTLARMTRPAVRSHTRPATHPATHAGRRREGRHHHREVL